MAIAGFDYTDIQGQVSFSDQSLNAGTWNWDFGTGDTSVLQNPQYTYAGNGSYIVTQIVENTCFSDTISDTLIIYVTNVTENFNDLIYNIYPNPNTGRFNLAVPGSQYLCYELTDCLGRVLQAGEIDSGNPEIVLSVSEKGSYFLRILVNGSVITRKIIVE
ncbi:MAG: T9SS type A sorting domain-containing protein [Bacteroidota bacterium]